MEWISVLNQMPADDTQVLIFAEDEIFICKHMRDFLPGWPVSWVGDTAYFHSDYNKVTHWMPLPAKPTETQQPDPSPAPESRVFQADGGDVLMYRHPDGSWKEEEP